jgi:hypothetical protein
MSAARPTHKVRQRSTGLFLGRMSLVSDIGWVAYGCSYSFPEPQAVELAERFGGEVVLLS